MSLNLDCALTGKRFSKNTVSDIIRDPDTCFIRGFQVNNVSPLNAIKMYLKCHMLKSSDDLYVLTLLTNVIVYAKSVDLVQQQSILCLHCLTQRLLKHFSRQ